MKQNPLFVGSAVAIVTPFSKDGSKVDFDTLQKLISRQIENGTASILACGTTGEPCTLSTEEQFEVVSFTAQQASGCVPVIAGTGGNNTAEVIRKANRYAELEVDAQLCVTPYYNKTTQQGLIAHYTAIADNTQLPIILYNVPGRTGLDMSPETIAVLAKHPHIIALKEANPDISRFSKVVSLVKDDITLYSGCDELVQPMLSLGALGVISVSANVFPAIMQELVLSFLNGEIEKARKMQLEILPAIELLFSEISPIPVKAALSILGLCEETLRLPLVKMNKDKRKALENMLEKMML